ncbi:unnamed protein product [Macrosiphum euphorbiae]|uniref:Uncharacterized protein n=1 Tax=Macrosiphum euphorbiae TaxID=13131 RepID=A0AAV0X989_9HEMI|nr:unnamed protein product [Macrosiphum euphorbiae]
MTRVCGGFVISAADLIPTAQNRISQYTRNNNYCVDRNDRSKHVAADPDKTRPDRCNNIVTVHHILARFQNTMTIDKPSSLYNCEAPNEFHNDNIIIIIITINESYPQSARRGVLPDPRPLRQRTCPVLAQKTASDRFPTTKDRTFAIDVDVDNVI